MSFFRSKVNRPILVMMFIGFFLALTLLVFAFVTNQSAEVVIGHATLNQNEINGQDPSSNTLYWPSSVYTDGTKLYIAEYLNHRVLIYNTVPTVDNAPADVVVGQPNMNSNFSNQGGSVGANTLYNPRSVYTDGSKLYIADNNNHRVLIYNAVPTVDNASADVVVGQSNMTSRSSNQGGSIAANGLYYPKSVYTDGTKLYIADDSNNRVLIYNTVPTVNNASADVVVGQPNMTSGSSDQGGSVAANTLHNPNSVYTDGTKLYIADRLNHRALIYNTVPTVNNAPADVVVGQPDMTSDSANQGGSVAANTLYSPYSVYNDGTKLYIADCFNHRVLIYNTVPTVNNASADAVVGQANMTSNDSNQGSGVAVNTLRGPRSVYTDGVKLYIADNLNNRVLIYNTVPTINNVPADVVVGQPNMTSGSSNQGSNVAANTLYSPYSVYTDGAKLYIADAANNRVLIYNTVPTVNHASADVVVGQPNMTSNSSNQGGNAAANTLNDPSSVYTDGTKLYIADAANNRVLIYNTVPTSDNASADVVVGQFKMNFNLANKGGLGANTLYSPYSVYTDGTKLYIADYSNHRVLIYNTVPTVNDASADVVVGQPDMTSNSLNQGGSVTANTLFAPYSVYTDGTKLYIADSLNHRVLIYNTVPTVNDASADVVVGQPDMTSNSLNQGSGVAANTLWRPYSVYIDGTKLYIADYTNHRVLIYNTVPTANNAPADVVVGQSNMTSNSSNQGGNVAANTLNDPSSVYTDGTKLYIADYSNHRVLIYDDNPSTPTYTPTSTATPTGTPTDTPTSTATQTVTPTNTPTSTDTQNYTPTNTPTSSPTYTPTHTPTVSSTGTPTQTATPMYSPTETITFTATYTITETATKISSQTFTPTSTNTPTISPTPTNTGIIPSPTSTATPVFIATHTPALSGFFFKITHALVRVSRGESAKMVLNLSQASRVRIKIYAITGREIITLRDEYMSVGRHEIEWNGSHAGSGMHLVYCEAGQHKARGKIVVVR